MPWLTARAVLAPTNSRLKYLNDKVADRFLVTFAYYKSADSDLLNSLEAQEAAELRYPQDHFNSIEVGASLPDHKISLKKGFIVKFLRNMKLSAGHVNGTTYVVVRITTNLLFLTSVSGSKTVSRLKLPRMNCTISKDGFLIPGFRRRQFSFRVCFAMTINKAQGQSIPGALGIDLNGQCFAHGQLYIALSRTKIPRNVLICTADGTKKTKNGVFTEFFDTSNNFPREMKFLEKFKTKKM